MTDGPPAPEPGASLASDDRGVSTTLGYTLTLSITAVLLAGLLTAGGTLIEDQRQAVATDELTVTGQQLAGGFEDADRLAGTTENGTVRVNVWLPDGVGMGGYTLQILNQPTPAGQPAQGTIVATADGTDASRNVSFRTEFPVANRTVPGGPVTIDYRDTDGDGTGELVVEESMDLAPEPPEPAAFGHDVVVFVDRDTGELSSVAPGGEITRYGVDARAIGPKQADLDGDGRREIPFVNSANELRLVDESGETQTLASDAAYSPGDYTSLLGVGEWRGETSVFYLNTSATVDGEASIHRVEVGDEPAQVTVNENGIDAMAVAGIGDMNDDGDDELVYVEGATTNVAYVEDGEESVTGIGASGGYGIGDLRQFDDGERDALPFVDGANEIRLYRESASSDLTGGAAKSAIAGVDWTDDDDALEVVYVDSADGTLRYVTLGGDGGEIESDGEDVRADESTGVA